MNDLISRQAAIDALGKASDELYENIKKGATFPQRQWFDGMAQAQSILENLPSAQPECEDAVSRFEVLRLIDYSSNDLNDSVDNRYFQGKVKELPSVTPKQPGWIPVTERLPEDDRPVLVTLKWSEDDYEVTTGEYWRDSTVCHGWGNFGDVVIAWQPLPTPYREGGQDG